MVTKYLRNGDDEECSFCSLSRGMIDQFQEHVYLHVL
jgi:hypothetical protein